jgi:hypothetical protein
VCVHASAELAATVAEPSSLEDGATKMRERKAAPNACGCRRAGEGG